MKAVDLFAGIGGCRLGFQQAMPGLEFVYTSEIDPKALVTYNANFDGSVEPSDITTVYADDIPPHDILLAGFPCQAFSSAGLRRGFSDTRGTLFFDVMRVILHHEPSIVFLENVKNLTTHDGGRTFKTITLTLEQAGYTVHHKLLNSKDFGVPQNRPRVYIVAFKNNLPAGSFDFPAPTDSTKTVSDILLDEVDPKYYLTEKYLECLVQHRKAQEAKGNGFGYEVLNPAGIANTVVCGGMGRERNLVVQPHPTQSKNTQDVRKLTPREMARLQGLPESFALPVADTHLYKQLGNTVTVPVVAEVARQIAHTLREMVK